MKWCPRKLDLSPCCKPSKSKKDVAPTTIEEKVEEAVKEAQIELRKDLDREPNTDKKRKFCCIS